MTPPSLTSENSHRAGAERPLAEKMRPRTLNEFVGQSHLLGPRKFLANALKGQKLPSLILWGPPGSGKTTLARLLAEQVGAELISLSAVLSGVKDIRAAIARVKRAGPLFAKTTILFVDEIHRFNKSQQDALLPHVERGTITLIGATTENPSFEVNSALLSRCKILVLEALDDSSIRDIVTNALDDQTRGLGDLELTLTEQASNAIVSAASGDARVALNTLETAARAVAADDRDAIRHKDVEEAMQRRVILYDKSGEQHYNTVSAFIKSMRGSDPDAALYYMNRMLEGGEDPLFIFRRILIFASEDIGNADPQALQIALTCMQAFQAMGLPEGVLPMTQAVTYLACAPKSNAVIVAYGKSRQDALNHGNLPVPLHILNAPTALQKKLGHGRGYKYPHNFEGNYVHEEYLPEPLRGRRYYEPSENGAEAKIAQRLREMRAQTDPQDPGES
ncbi:recombination protein MgsA [Bradymonas sediminis]|nr:recombination protein MgsA [Bradymonas sediminis]